MYLVLFRVLDLMNFMVCIFFVIVVFIGGGFLGNFNWVCCDLFLSCFV